MTFSSNVDKTAWSVNYADHQAIGRGRSGVVYRVRNPNGDDLACKVFDSCGLTKVVQWLFLGAPNPYMWNADAIQCAKIRRDILSVLVPVWMNGEVAVAGADVALWNNHFTTFELQTRFVSGRAAALHHTLVTVTNNEADRLWRQVLPNLRSRLQRAGFHGLLWQAGIGNPVALNNFLYESNSPAQKSESRLRDGGRWVWIDLESGVPAIFPISLKVLFQYSLSHWRRNGRPLFDDVDVDQLQNYLQSNTDQLTSTLGQQRLELLNQQASKLGEHQQRWKALGRIESAIHYRLMQGDIDGTDAEYYLHRKARWIFREIGRGMRSTLKSARRMMLTAFKAIRSIDIMSFLRSGWRFLTSQKYREDFVHGYLDNRISSWTARGQMADSDAEILRAQLHSPESSVYIMDFGIHLAIKPAIKFVQYLVLPGLFAIGALSGPVVAALVVTGGALGRTGYTLGRLLQSAMRGYERPWVALGVGVLPVVGNLAYPTQMLYSIGGEDEVLGRFMLDDGFARMGQHLPIWGGADTWTEHFLNRIPSKTIEYWAMQRRIVTSTPER